MNETRKCDMTKKYTEFDMHRAYSQGREYEPCFCDGELSYDIPTKHLSFWEWLNKYNKGDV